MTHVLSREERVAVAHLKRGGIGVVPTDTIYGIVGRALSQEAVARLYVVRRRDRTKPFIVLIASLDDLALFDIALSPQQVDVLRTVWAAQSVRKTSVIITCPQKKWHYLHRGTQAIAFRLVHTPQLRALIAAVGPLVAPSANLQNLPPAQTAQQARAYFGNHVDFIIDGGVIIAPQSRIMRIDAQGHFTCVRD